VLLSVRARFFLTPGSTSVWTCLYCKCLNGAHWGTLGPWVWGCVHTNRVESSPIQSSQTHKGAAVTLWLTYNDRHGRAYTPAESSRVQSHKSCRVKSFDAVCFIFVSQTPVIGRDGRNGCREAYSFSEGPRRNLRRLAFWIPEPRLTLMITMFITTKTTAPPTTVMMFLLLLGLLFKVFIRYFLAY
jgi:hypothetical protein